MPLLRQGRVTSSSVYGASSRSFEQHPIRCGRQSGSLRRDLLQLARFALNVQAARVALGAGRFSSQARPFLHSDLCCARPRSFGFGQPLRSGRRKRRLPAHGSVALMCFVLALYSFGQPRC